MRPTTARRRKTTPSVLLLLVFLGALLALGTLPAGAKSSKAPVKISGKVNKHGSATAGSTPLAVTVDDIFFEPTFIKAAAGATVQLQLENKGSLQHTFTIDATNVDEELSPGKKASVSITMPTNGKPLVFYCQFHGGQGMKGALYVKAGASAAGGTTKTKTAGEGSGSDGYGY